MADAPPLASTTVYPLPPPRGPPVNPPDDGVTFLGRGFAKLRGDRADRERQAADAAAAGAHPPAAATIHTPAYTFLMDCAATLAPVRVPAGLPVSLDVGYPDAPPAEARSGVEEVVLAARAAGVDFETVAAATREGGDGSGGGGDDSAPTSSPRPLLISYRNNLRKVLGTAHDPGAGWVVDAAAITTPGGRPVVCLDIVAPPSTGGEDFPGADRFCYWGYRFEALCTAAGVGEGAPPPPARVGRPEWAALVLRRLGGCDVVLAAETDGFCPDLARRGGDGGTTTSSSPAMIPHHALVELKTLRWPTHAGGAAGLHARKAPTWFVQSWLGGAAELWAGGRDERGGLTRVDRFRVRDLPAWSASQGGRWCPAAIVHSGGAILDWMVAAALGAGAGAQVRFEYAPPARRPPGGGQRRLPAPEPGVLTARVAAGGELGARVRRAVEEGRMD